MNENTNTDKFIKGVSSQTIITFLLGLVDIVSFSIMSRLLSQQDFGYYASIVAVSMIFSSLAENGIGSAIVQRKRLDYDYVNCAFSMSFIIGTIITVIMFLTSSIIARFVADASMTVPLKLYSVTLICTCVTSVNFALMQRDLLFFRIGLIKLVSLIITTIVAIVLALKGFGYYAILVKGILASIFSLIISFFAIKVRYKFSVNLKRFSEIWGFSGWLMASVIFRNLANQIDRLMMSSLFSVTTLGFYSRPKEFISSISDKINYIFDSVMFPILSSFQESKQRVQKTFKETLYFFNLGGMLLALLFFFNSELIIRIFFGEEWIGIKPLFQILSFAPILNVNGRVGDVFLRSMALTKSQFYFRVAQLVSSIAFIVLCARWGIVAVAIAAMTSYFLVTSVKLSYIANKIEVSLFEMVSFVIRGNLPFLYYILLYYITNSYLPHSWLGNILQFAAFLILSVLLLLLCPSTISKLYKERGYMSLLNYLKTR